MATVTTPYKPFDRADADRRVRHPLQAIRGYIRRYVLIEGIALTVIFAAACFWLGLGLDYLLWAALSYDWLYSFDEATSGNASVVFRVGILVLAGACLAALVGFKIFRRMFKEFSDSAVALVLERRYPKELGDRLITAVELADPHLAQKYGYSQMMVDTTIRAAAERVEKLPIGEIFRWGWLKFLVVMALLSTVCVYLAVGLAWCVWNAASPMEYVVRFHHTASIWAERDLVLQASYWPPNTLIELIRFPEAGLRVPREEDRPDVKVRAIRWAIADREAPRGWRALQVADLNGLLPAELLNDGLSKGTTLNIRLPRDWGGWIVDLDDFPSWVPAGAVPQEWGWQGATSGHVRSEIKKEEVIAMLQGPATDIVTPLDAVDRMLDWHNFTVDKIELQLQHIDAKGKKSTGVGGLSGIAAEAVSAQFRDKPVVAAMIAGHKADYDTFQAILAKLEELAADPAMARTIRKMDDPDEVIATRKSKAGVGTTNCTGIENRKYLFPLAALKESCQFSISTQDYWTPWRKIELVPPPMIDRLLVDKDEPAYLYYRMPENPMLLKGKRQRVSAISVATTGPYSKILVPIGTHVSLRAHSDQKLKDVRVAEPEAKKREEKTSITPPTQVELSEDRQTFTCGFQDVRRIIEFDFEFKDQDGVKGRRRVIIMPLEDQAPRLHELALATLPRVLPAAEEGGKGIATGPRFVITPDAYLRWRGKIEDDHGLAKLDYKYELQEIDFQNLFAEASETKPGDSKGDQKKPGRGMGAEIVAGGFVYVPGPSAYGFFAVSYYGGLAQIVKEGSLPPPAPRVDFIALERIKQRLVRRFDADATAEEMGRLLAIQPANRKLLLEALGLTAEKRQLAGFVERLKEAQQTEGFLREVMDFAGLKAEERKSLEPLATSDPGEALARVLQKLKADPDQLTGSRQLLDKQPERTILLKYELQDEDGVFGFDVREKLGFIKAIGSTSTQKHYAMRVSIVATDNNVDTGPGVTTASVPYHFLIVSENELLALMMRDQRGYFALLQKAKDELETSRQNLEGQLGDYRKASDEPTKLLVRADVARKALRDGGIVAKAIFGRYEGLLREMEFNRMKKDRIDKLKGRVAEPLGMLTGTNGNFAKTEDLAAKLYKELSPDADKKEKADLQQQGNDPALLKELAANHGKHLANADKTLLEMNDLIRELRKILDAMWDGFTDDEALEQLVLIEQLHRAVDAQLRGYSAAWRRWVLEQLGGGKK